MAQSRLTKTARLGDEGRPVSSKSKICAQDSMLHFLAVSLDGTGNWCYDADIERLAMYSTSLNKPLAPGAMAVVAAKRPDL